MLGSAPTNELGPCPDSFFKVQIFTKFEIYLWTATFLSLGKGKATDNLLLTVWDTKSGYIVQVALEFMILLPQPPECWYDGHVVFIWEPLSLCIGMLKVSLYLY